MKKRKINFVLLFILLTLLSYPAFAFADETAASTQIITPNYTYLTTVGASLSIQNGYATCEGNLSIFRDYDTSITITLQRSSDGVNWSNVTSWSNSFTGRGAHSIERGYYVLSGYKYRVLNTSKVYSGSSVIETATSYSPEKTY